MLLIVTVIVFVAWVVCVVCWGKYVYTLGIDATVWKSIYEEEKSNYEEEKLVNQGLNDEIDYLNGRLQEIQDVIKDF